MSENQIGDDGARALSALINLRTLDVCENQIGNDILDALEASLSHTQVTTE